jgi:hypothetical protein
MILNEDTARQEHRAIGRSTFKLYPGQSVAVFNQNNVWKTHGAPAPDFCRHVLCAPDWQ